MNQYLHDYLDYHARVNGDITFVSEGQQSLSYSQALDRVNRIAAKLDATGLRAGDRIALLGKNSIDGIAPPYASISRTDRRHRAVTPKDTTRISRGARARSSGRVNVTEGPPSANLAAQ